MDSLNANAASARARRLTSVCRPEIACRLQRVATGIFVTGFAGTVVASRVLAPITAAGGGGHASAPPPIFDAPVSLASGERAIDSVSIRMQETRRLLIALRQAVEVAGAADDTSRIEGQARAHEIARSLALIDQATRVATFRRSQSVAFGQCAASTEHAVAFLSTSNFLPIGAHLSIHGTEGVQSFAFASGTSQGSVIKAINAFTTTTGVEAKQNDQNSSRVELRTIESGADAFVNVHRINGNDIIFAEPIGGPALGDLKDYGANALVLRAVVDEP